MEKGSGCKVILEIAHSLSYTFKDLLFERNFYKMRTFLIISHPKYFKILFFSETRFNGVGGEGGHIYARPHSDMAFVDLRRKLPSSMDIRFFSV